MCYTRAIAGGSWKLESDLEHFAELQDENRYNAGRGAHINLKRAERARVAVNKIPGIVSVMDHTLIWCCSILWN